MRVSFRANLAFVAGAAELRKRSSAPMLASLASLADIPGGPQLVPRTLLPRTLFQVTPWVQIMAGRWRWLDHVNLGEGRTINLWLELLANVRECRGSGLLDASDSQVATGADTRGRSSRWPINRICQRRTALEAVSDLRRRDLWTSSLFQPGDAGTREGLEEAMVVSRSGVLLPLWVKGRIFLDVGSPDESVGTALTDAHP